MSRLSTDDALRPRAPRHLRLLEPAPHTRRNRANQGGVWAQRYRSLLRVTDASVVVAAASLGGAIGFRIDPASGALPDTALYLMLSAVVAGTWFALLGAHQTRGVRVVGAGALEYKRVAGATLLAFGLLAIAFLLTQTPSVRGYFLVALPLGLVGLLLNRRLWRTWLAGQRERGHHLSRAIVVGDVEDVEYVLTRIQALPSNPYDVVGVAVGSPFATRRLHTRIVSVLADLDSVADAVLEHEADTVIVAGRPRERSDDYVRRLSWDLEPTGASLVLASRLTDVAGPRISFSPIEGLPLMHVELPQFEGPKHLVKRSLDVVASAVALVLLSPLLALIALLVRLDGPGPVLFEQERVGRGGRTFRMLKFRSMVADAETALIPLLQRNQGAGVLFKLRDDPRVTRIGRVLRRYSLDELPQLWNVLLGDMSIVGPRPPLPREVAAYERDVHRRLYIKPGLTGMWQVSGRSDLSWEESVRLDLYYVENWSLAVDLMIIWRTARVLLDGKGAY